MDLKRIYPILVLSLFLFACSSDPQPQVTVLPTQANATPQPTAVKATTESTSLPESPTPSPSLEFSEESESDDQASAEQPPQVDTSLSADYGVIASFHWLGMTTPTDITYNYEGWFKLLPDGSLQMVDENKGYAKGEAGINLDGECIEAVPVDIEYDFTIIGKQLDVPIEDTNPEILMKYPDLVTGDAFKVFEIQFASPEVKKIEIQPFTNCWPDADQEFINNLGTYWIDVIPFIPPEYRTVPADEGYSCPGVLSFNEEGLGSLEVCYNIFKP